MNDLHFRIVDAETTGMDHEVHAVLELASLDLVDGRLGDGRSSLVNPMQTIPAEASAVHGLTEADIADAPLLTEVAPSIMNDGKPDFFVAHQSQFEEAFLANYFSAPVICTMKCAMRVWPEFRYFNLGYLQHMLFLGDLGPRSKPRHRSPADCFITAHVLGRLLGEASVEDLATWSREPAMPPRMPFGKHEGQLWPDLPHSYLDWIINKPNEIDEDMKWCARQELKRRLDQTRAKYLNKAFADILAVQSVFELNAWWDGSIRDRYEHGMTMKGDAGYDAIVKACAERKATLLAESSQGVT